MSNLWPPGTVKIHEGCGGLVRWVEAVRTPGVGYYGHCLDCDREHIDVESIIPIEIEEPAVEPTDVVNETRRKKLEKLHWDHKEDWESNQERLREEVSA